MSEIQARDVAGALPGLVRIASTTLLRTAERGAAEIVHDLRVAIEGPEPAPDASPAPGPDRARAALLLDRSRDVHDPESVHPAYARILDELVPDEARLLVLFLREGPQPSVDVRSAGVLGPAGSTLLVPHVTMVGPAAGLRAVERVPSYLHNLARLGLVWFSREEVGDPLAYQVLEAQPVDVPAGLPRRRLRFVRRSVHLTPFGEDFCRTAFAAGPAQR